MITLLNCLAHKSELSTEKIIYKHSKLLNAIKHFMNAMTLMNFFKDIIIPLSH